MNCTKCGGEVAYPGGGLWRCKVCRTRHRHGGNLVALGVFWFIYGVLTPALVLFLIATIGALIASCSSQDRARNSNGEATIELQPCERLISAAWQSHSPDLWLLTRPLAKGESPTTYMFRNHAAYPTAEGRVTLVEKPCP